MKWGVRNYQNPDGSLTPAGRERYGRSSSNYERFSKSVDSSKSFTENSRKLMKDPVIKKASKELNKSYDGWIKSDEAINKEYEKFESNNKLVNAYLSKIGESKHPDALIKAFDAYAEDTPRIQKMFDVSYEAKRKFEKAGGELVNILLGEYSGNKVTVDNDRAVYADALVEDALKRLNEVQLNNGMADMAKFYR